MAAYNSVEELKLAVTAAVYQNNAGRITAEDLQELLHDIIDTLAVFGGGGGSGGTGTGVSNGTLLFEKDGSSFRFTIRDGEMCLDQALTATGFDGTEGVDWKSIRQDSIDVI